MEKKFIDKRRFNIKYIYLFNNGAYTDAKTLCEKLGLSYRHCVNTMAKENDIYTKKINISVVKEGRKNIYRNGKFPIDLDKFCKQFGLLKKEVTTAIKETGTYINDITITRSKNYNIKLTYLIQGKEYPLSDGTTENKVEEIKNK